MAEHDDLLLRSEVAFATGAATYIDAHPDFSEEYPRIYIHFRPDGVERGASYLALLDTGGHFCILNEEIVDRVADQLTSSLGQTRLRTAHGDFRGELYFLRIDLVAEVGDDLTVETIAFITPGWKAPNIVGYFGVLDRIRLALDPQVNRIYFAQLS